MTYEFTIISIDDSRESKKNKIRSLLDWHEASIEFVNGKNPEELRLAKKRWSDVDTPGPFKAGEFGIFYSVLNCLEYGASNNGILYFEDDAMPVENFQERVEYYLEELPKNADVFAIWSPLNQKYDYTEVSNFNNKGEPIYQRHQGSIFDYGHSELARLWQGYGNVAMYFTKRGCLRLLNFIKIKGFFSPIDCIVCIAVHGGYLNGFALKPDVSELVKYDWNAPTTIHKSSWGMIDDLIKEKND